MTAISTSFYVTYNCLSGHKQIHVYMYMNKHQQTNKHHRDGPTGHKNP